jgi:hypothetical protein
MLRLLDARTGVLTDVRPGSSRLLRVQAHLAHRASDLDVSALRVLLLADLLARTAELGGLQVLTAVVFQGEPPAQPSFAERAAGLLGMHPPAVRASSAEVAASLRGPAHIGIVGPDDDLYQEQGALVARVGAVRVTSSEGKPAGIFTGDSALAVRFVLMAAPHHWPVDLDDTALTQADQRTRSWRLRVAEWAESPSQPIPEGVGSAMQTAFSDLDTVRVLTLLSELAEKPGLSPGAKFETFAFADRILALDLARKVGQPRQ